MRGDRSDKIESNATLGAAFCLTIIGLLIIPSIIRSFTWEAAYQRCQTYHPDWENCSELAKHHSDHWFVPDELKR